MPGIRLTAKNMIYYLIPLYTLARVHLQRRALVLPPTFFFFLSVLEMHDFKLPSGTTGGNVQHWKTF
jgi:hypothetical protein